jgi:hypothetical protein
MDIHHERIKKSTITKHSHISNRHICVQDLRVVAKIPHYYKMKIKEALEIKRFETNINHCDGLKLKEAWKLVLQHIKNNSNFLKKIQYVDQSNLLH